LLSQALKPGAEVFVLGSQALSEEISAVGLLPKRSRTQATEAVCVGFDPYLRWNDLNQGCFAVQAGAAWYACNSDLNRPTEDGMAIGMGGILRAMSEALPGQTPILGGKPARPLLDEVRRRLGGTKPLIVGDRLDTDIEGAYNAGWDSLFVLSGSHDLTHLASAAAPGRPTYVGENLTALLQPAFRWSA
jgi:ribonucleotide monophosphatase NagD (HAD superfamily)